ncbi:MAG: alpha-2-macroglobulin family protein, partial [Candidatus Omnitrophota bacterium]|nr:alpha-2-macroglobulin family protein [Candidatus Omnitrophota bacterium]
YQMLHLTGAVKLLEVPIQANFIPNIFVTAVSSDHFQMKTHSLPIIVPPEEKFLNVRISSDKEVYGPRDEGKFSLEVTDKDGEPVSGEISLGIVDASVYYIQNEYVPDIREFYYGQKRQLSVTTQTSFQQRTYTRLVRGEKGELITEDQRRYLKDSKERDLAKKAETEVSARSGEKILGDERLRSDVSFAAMDAVGGMAEGKMRAASAPMVSRSLAKPMEEMAEKQSKDKEDIGKGNRNEKGPLAQAETRTDFRSTVIWQPSIVTDAEGRASLTVTFPDSLTTWRATARAITRQTTVGNVTQETRTKKDIIVRLQAPRFFTERDMATVSANVHNYTEEEQKIKVTIDAKGLHVVGEPSSWITVPAGGEKRVDWVCEVPKAGLADIKVTAQAKTEADAMARSYPIIPHGIEKFIAQAVVLKSQEPAEQTAEFVLNVPKERIKESTSLQLVLSPSMAAALLDALPYLADYPYGCVEQTMSRFLPAVIVAKTMQNLGLTEQEVMAYISDVMEPRHDPEGHPQRRDDATFTKLKSMTQDGLKRLYDFQHSDGGWGWWKDDDTNRFMTAYVLWGISLARDAGADVRGDVISRAASYLQTNLVEEENNPDMLAWMLYALAQARTGSEFQDKQEQRLWEMRDKLNPYTRALFALSLQLRNNKEYADVLVRNLANGVKEDKDNATAHWGESGIYYRWSDGGTEATAFVLKALVNIDPQSVYVDPAVKWLALNRRGARWSNTRDTAIALLSLADYLKTTRELNPAYEFDILVNGQSVRQGKVDSQNVLTFGRLVEVPAEAIRDGKNTVQVKFKGQGAMYLSGYLKYFTLEEGITSAGNEIFVERKYLKESKKETLMKGYVSDWAELKDGDAVKSGERIKVELTVEAKNNYEYLVFEDYKPAGFEAVELKSGTGYAQAVDGKGKPAGGQAWLYQEFRDQKVAIFITKLKQGTYRISYELRAEVPGEFHAMPNQAHAMYVPEIRANSSEMRLTVEERPEIE